MINGNGKTYNDPIKQVARGKIRDFIARHYSDRRLGNLKVLCFPGAEVEGEEALEVKEVYDKLGIPRANIVGLEYDRRTAERLRAANLGIEVVCQDDVSFLLETDRTFDVISLDYTSNFGDSQRYAIDLIAQRCLLGEEGTLFTNYFGSREKGRSQETIIHTAARHDQKISLYDLAMNYERSIKRVYDTAENSTLKEARSKGLQICISGCMLAGESALNPCAFRKLYKKDQYERLMNMFREFADKEGLESKILGKNKDELFARTTAFRTNMFSQFLNSIMGSIKEEYLLMHLWFSLTKPYINKDHEAYSYVSNKGSPMFMDLWHFKKYRVRDDFFGFDIPRIHVLPDCFGRKRQELKESAKRLFHETVDSRDKLTVLERQFLGSSYVPIPRQKKERKQEPQITKEEALELLASGIPAKEIADAFSGFSEGQLRAFKAHITMGTYNEQNNGGSAK